MVRTALLLALLAPAALAQIAPLGQCGGKAYTGTTTCVSGYSCKFVSEWYSQCVAGTAPVALASPSPSPAAPAVPMCNSIGGQDNARVPGSKPRVVSKCLKPGQFALTFDDGPRTHEPELLTLLKSLDVKATFFLTSNFYVNAAQSPYSGWIKDLYNAGHQIAQHTSQHKDLTSLSQNDVRSQLQDCENTLYNIIGKRPAMMRPPMGNVNDSVLKVADSLGITAVVMWNIDSGDWSHHNAGQAVQAVKNGIEKCPNGSGTAVVLAHSTENSVIDYVKQVVPYLKSKGYTFVTMAECLEMEAYK